MTTGIQGRAQEAVSEPALRLTEKAIEQVKTILARENLEGYGLRMGVVTSGCSGYSYHMDFEKEQKPADIVIEIDGLKIYVDSSIAKHLQGTVIDYTTGLQGAGFKFNNPNVTGTCGCGTSFST
ncbi:MAG TPA: iron-sulfur cluster assembly accessory protein [Candidatus Binatia bacterium]|jgi:iron-sulfur cluster assembly accessory protein|nr:iron-sulfur cluster assembly accessory protein [Candidatus Binatia bacterium]